MPATIRILCLLLLAILAAGAPARLHAGQSGAASAPHGTPGDFEKKLEQLRASQQMFPLDEKLKRTLAEAYANYGSLLLNRRQYEQAEEYFIKAGELYPDEAVFSLSRGICNYYLKRYDIARYELEHARRNGGDSPDILYYLGQVLYDTDNRLEAVALWELALKSSPGRHEIINALKKARKEMSVEDSMDRGNSSRFNLTYDPGVNASFALAILDILETAANQVGSELGHFPAARVPVTIYKRDDYKNVTNSPDWSGGVYDGTIRLPFGALGEITPPLRAILFHEYAHVVVFDLTRGNCPAWLNEGIAEMFGQAQSGSPAPDGGKEALKGGIIDIRRLEGSFGGLSSAEAARAYQQSNSLVSYLVTSFGWHRVKEILVNLGKGMNTAAAIAAALQDYSLSYDGLIREWRESVAAGS
jgi:tetratricopeptide (TPR) repeat protein